MVIKRFLLHCISLSLFESSVISYGNQTSKTPLFIVIQFESSVISYGNQTVGQGRTYQD